MAHNIIPAAAAAVLISLSGCVSAEYHTAGSAYTAIQANRACAHAFDPVNRQYAVAGAFGLIGGILAASAQLSSDEHASAQRDYDACMLGYGWAKNQ